VEDVRDLYLRLQEQLCLWCGLPLERFDYVLDHNHSTGLARGVIHYKCNSEVGAAEKEGSERFKRYEWDATDLREVTGEIVYSTPIFIQRRYKPPKQPRVNPSFLYAKGLVDGSKLIKYPRTKGGKEFVRKLLFEQQEGKCAYCGKVMTDDKFPTVRRGKTVMISSLVIDSDHDTGIVRGLMHRSCDVLMGTRVDNAS
jgi:hypothetical protein